MSRPVLLMIFTTAHRQNSEVHGRRAVQNNVRLRNDAQYLYDVQEEGASPAVNSCYDGALHSLITNLLTSMLQINFLQQSAMSIITR